MKHVIALVLGGISLTACAATTTTAGMPAVGGLENTAFDYAPVRPEPEDMARFGYSLSGMTDGWNGEMRFESEGGGLAVDLEMNRGGMHTAAALDIAMPYLENGVRRFIGQTMSGDPVEVVLQAGPCLDPGSARHQTHFATVSVGGERFDGCAREVAATDRWTNYIASYLPAIDTCLYEMRNQAEHVTLAYPVASATGVRLGNRLGQRWECVTRQGNQAVNAMRTLEAGDIMAGENDPIFVRGEMPMAGEGCYVYESVRTADGELIGAFGFDACTAPTGPMG